jgi:hypothetical protein
MQAEVDLRQRLLFLDGANSIVEVCDLINVLRRVFHAGRERRRRVAENCGCGGGRGEGNEGRVMRGGSVPALQWRRGETKAEASMRCDGFARTILSFRNNLNSRSQRAGISGRRVLVDVCCLAGRAEKTGG